ncbi:pH-response regulator protein palH/rim21 [Orbilia ellipsospora]|uniref:PH-response regulator protein palH/rim21 n=1 Tax=Orbilia ellipsospora TaxID=2528407 RepID=A0AAV9XQZ4_9PEZI
MALHIPTPTTTLWTNPIAAAPLPIRTTSIPNIQGFPNVAAAIWRESTTDDDIDPSCTPFLLPSLGLVKLEPNNTITLQAEATFTPVCYINNTASYLDSTNITLGNYVSGDDLRDHFYATSIPMAYAIGGTTVLAYILLIILLISPPGSRPWLQKVATLTVVISLTVAWAELNQLMEYQHYHGYTNGRQIRDHIINGIRIQITRVISDTFLYLAQVQTLMRLFPRHREKLLILWAGLVLIVLDFIFNILNNFFSKQSSPKSFLDAIPALSYLLQIALSLLYGCCVLYYMFSHRQFSIMMPWSINNQHKHAADTSKVAMPLIALMTCTTIFVPLVFFVLDISDETLAGWGDFVRWIGACAASVIVWEMADRIEYFEKQTIHAGILGRQVFEGDEMLHGVGGRVVNWEGSRGFGSDRKDGPGGPGGGGAGGGILGRPVPSIEKVDYGEHNNKGKPPDNQAGVQRPTPSQSMATTGSTTYIVTVHPSQTPSAQARPSSTVSQSTSSARETNRGTSTISDLAISPANTPSIDLANGALRRNITFSENAAARTGIIPLPVGKSNALSHTYRSGQAPFSPEDFSKKKSGSASAQGPSKGIGLFRWFRRDGAQENITTRTVPEAERTDDRIQEGALGHEVTLNEPHSQHVAAQSNTISDDDAEGEHYSIDPGPSASSSPFQARQTTPPAKQHHPELPQDDEEEDERGGSSLLRRLWKQKYAIPIKHRSNEPFPITYIPAQVRGNSPMNPEEIEMARRRELERIRAGGSTESSSEGTSSSPSNTSDAIITRFDQHPSQRGMVATSGTESIARSSASAGSRIRHSVDFDLEGTTSAPSVSTRRQLQAHSGGISQSITPPPLAARSSTASPTGSHRTSSTGSWSHRASPNSAGGGGGGGGGRLPPRPYNPNEGSHLPPGPTHSQSHHQHQQSHQPEGIGPNLPVSSKNAAPTKLLGRPLDPTVIPEEAEGSSIASIRGMDHSGD